MSVGECVHLCCVGTEFVETIRLEICLLDIQVIADDCSNFVITMMFDEVGACFGTHQMSTARYCQ